MQFNSWWIPTSPPQTPRAGAQPPNPIHAESCLEHQKSMGVVPLASAELVLHRMVGFGMVSAWERPGQRKARGG